MAISLNPSGLVNQLEYSLYKGVSRAKADNQKSMEECISQMDKRTEEKSSAFKTEVKIKIVCAVALVALTALGIAAQWKMESANFQFDTLKSDLANLQRNVDTPYSPMGQNIIKHLTNHGEKVAAFNQRIQDLHNDITSFNTTKKCYDGLLQIVNLIQQIYPIYPKISHNQLDHEYKKQEMRWQQLSQAHSNSPEQSTLNDVKDMIRRQQQARAAAG